MLGHGGGVNDVITGSYQVPMTSGAANDWYHADVGNSATENSDNRQDNDVMEIASEIITLEVMTPR